MKREFTLQTTMEVAPEQAIDIFNKHFKLLSAINDNKKIVHLLRRHQDHALTKETKLIFDVFINYFSGKNQSVKQLDHLLQLNHMKIRTSGLHVEWRKQINSEVEEPEECEE